MNHPSPRWYVAMRQPKAGAYVRNSQIFADEGAARAFAREMLELGFEVTAGTINPHVPKKTIGPGEILNWLDEV